MPESLEAAGAVPLGVVGKVRFSVLMTAEPEKAPIDALVVSVGRGAARQISDELREKYPSPDWDSVVPEELSPYRAATLNLYPASDTPLRRIILTSHRDSSSADEKEVVSRATASAIRAVAWAYTPRLGLPLLGSGSIGVGAEELARTVLPIARESVVAHGGNAFSDVVFLCRDLTTETVIRQVWDGDADEDEVLTGRVDTDLVEWDPDNALVDHLDVTTYVRMIAAVAADRNTPLPLSIGLFGEWGSGKSYFMGLLQQEIAAYARSGMDPFCTRVAQIRFNAWHYADANLWASLAVQVFDQLALAQKRPSDDDETARQRFLRHLRIYREEETALKAKLKQANDHLSLAKTKLTEAEHRSRAAQAKFTQTAARDLVAAVAADEQVRKAVQETADEVSKIATEGAPTQWRDLRGLVTDLRSLSVDLPRLLRLTAKRGRRYLVAAVVLLVLGIVLFVLPNAFGLLGVPALLGGLAAAGSALAPIGKAVRGALRQAEHAADIADAAYERAAQRAEADLAPLRTQTEQAEIQRQKVAEQLADAQSAVTAAVVELSELGESQRLYKFIAERAGSDDYRRQLGVVSALRWDFEQLTARLEAASGDSDTPLIERIVLYIDDLDRCPPERVVQVLEAVHLLLAMKLFVVVVGVDPRWLLRSLERQFHDVLTGDGSSTSRNYLEKIFQIPFVLPGMTSSGFRALLGPAATTRSVAMPTVDPATVKFGASAPAAEPGSAIARAAEGKPPKTLDLVDVEIEFLTLLGPLVRTPRAAKRMANIYRMLRSTRNLTVETGRWLGDDKNPGEYQAVAQLLAVLTAAPRQFGSLVNALAERADDESWRAFIEHDVVSVLDPEHVVPWHGLAVVLTSVSTGERPVLDRMEQYKTWAPHVARFSFGLQDS
jgi:hypothetical protein